VYGNLTTPSLTIQKGSVFQGQCQMEGEPARVPLTNGKGKQAAKAQPEA
jgi:cytoskeletal protein CcmA (bactofilin family)